MRHTTMPRQPQLSRRHLLGLVPLGGIGAIAGCATSGPSLARAPGFPAEPWSLTAPEKQLLDGGAPTLEIVTREGPGSAVLRRLARPVPQGLDLSGLARRMEQTMRAADGVGLAGPQVGLSLRVATLMLGYRGDAPRVIFACNPVVTERSDETADGYEGCLSVPGVGGLVRRSLWVRVSWITAAGLIDHALASGPDAVLWQHEIDHLEGSLYTDKLRGELMPTEEMRRRRKELELRGQDETSELSRALLSSECALL